jgi:hypothetical protein
MFRSRTLFIVGAGASCEAGLPSGEELKGEIASLLDIRFQDGYRQTTGDHQITECLREHVRERGGRDINPYLHKAWRIRDVAPSAAISIDNFLDAHQGDEMIEPCGKLGIVKGILNAEGTSKLRPRERGDNRFNLRDLADTWYVNFFQMLTENVKKADAATVFDNVAIITFNYDRCIERFLVQALADYYDLSEAESQAIVATLAIYHPYGTVGSLPWQTPDHGVPFGSTQTRLLAAAGRVKTFAEGLDDDDLLTKIHDAVAKAETVVFLGFAFHPMNMELLRPGRKAAAQRIFATTLGLSKADESVIEDDIWRMLGKEEMDWADKQGIKPEMADATCRVFFQQYFRSLSAPVD